MATEEIAQVTQLPAHRSDESLLKPRCWRHPVLPCQQLARPVCSIWVSVNHWLHQEATQPAWCTQSKSIPKATALTPGPIDYPTCSCPTPEAYSRINSYSNAIPAPTGREQPAVRCNLQQPIVLAILTPRMSACGTADTGPQ